MKVEKIFNFMYSIGAAIVVYGALLKITHKPNADVFLTIGLITEVIIFTVTGFQELFKKQSVDLTSFKNINNATDNAALTKSVDELNLTIKQIFNR